MEIENYLDNELTSLRRYSEIEKENFGKGYDYWMADPYAKKRGERKQ